MPQLNPVELKWVAQYVPEVRKLVTLGKDEEPPRDLQAEIKAYGERQQKKEEKLQQIRDLVDMRKESIINATKEKVKDKEGNITLQEKRIKTKGLLLTSSKPMKAQKKGKLRIKYQSDPDREFDPTAQEASKVVEGLSDEATNTITQIIVQLEEITQQMQAAKSADDMPLFSPDELMEEIWTPLVREGVIPIAIIPAVRNRFDKLWAGANALYYKRNQQFTLKDQETSTGEKVAKKIAEHGEAGSSVGGSMAGAIMTCLGTAKQTSDMVNLVFTVTKNGCTLAGKALEKDLQGATDAVEKILTASVTAACGKTTGDLVGKIFKASSKGVIIAKKLAASPPDVRGAFDTVADAIGISFSCCDTGADPTNPWTHLGDAITTALKTTADMSQVIMELQKPNPDPAKVIELFSNSIGNITTTELKNMATLMHKDKLADLNAQLKPLTDKEKKGEKLTDDEKNTKADLQHKITLNTPLDTDSESAGKGLSTALMEMGKKLQDKDIIAKVEKKGEKKAKEATDAELSEVREQMNAQLRALFAEEDEQTQQAVEELYSIDRLVAQVKADQANIKLAKALLDTAGGIAANVLPMLGGPLKAKDFGLSVAAAVMRGRELHKWEGMVTDAKKAVNPQVSAFAAEVAELQHQLTNEILNAAFELAQAITGSVSIAYPPVDGATKALAAGQALKTYIYEKIFKPAKIARAWNIYKSALKEPNNQRLKRKALKINPTLAKYAMAYGALEMNDPFAREALRACDLNDMVLTHKDTNAAKVAAYLEAKLKDDIVVEGVLNEFVPAKGPALALATWNKNKKAAAKKDWKNEGTGNIDTALAELARTETEANSSSDSVKAAQACVDAATALVKALTSYQPMTTDGQPHTQFAQYLKDLAAEAQRKLTSFQENLTLRREALAVNLKLHGTRETNAKTAIAALTVATGAAKNIAWNQAGITDFCQSGAGKTLRDKIHPCADSPHLADAIQLLEDSFTVVVKGAAKITDDQNAIAKYSLLATRITEEIDDCSAVMTKNENEAKAEVQRLGAL
jgi:hypothetical protein